MGSAKPDVDPLTRFMPAPVQGPDGTDEGPGTRSDRIPGKGIHPYCITIDDEAQAYLPHMFGASNYTVIEDVGKLPYKVSDIYRRIAV